MSFFFWSAFWFKAQLFLPGSGAQEKGVDVYADIFIIEDLPAARGIGYSKDKYA